MDRQIAMADYYPGDAYTSPADTPRALREYVMLGSRWSPYSFFFHVILTYRKLALAGTYTDEVWTKSSYEVLKYLERCGAHFDIRGMDHVRTLSGPAVFVGNHMSTMETTILPGLICPIRPVTYVVKEKLSRGKIWGPIMRSRDPILVTRKDPRADLESVLTGGTERLGRGISVIIFPQGTRTNVFDRAHFNSLGIKLAARAGVPVIPVAVKTDYWGNSPIFRGFGPVHRDRKIFFEFGAPVTVEGRGKAAHEACLDFIEGRLRAWGAQVADRPAADATSGAAPPRG